jgi:hypothetical protein
MTGIVEYIVGGGICIWQVAHAENVKKDAQRKVSGAYCIICNTHGVS